MKKILTLTIITWMALCLAPQTTKAISLEDYNYDYSNYGPTNLDVPCQINLIDVNQGDEVSISIYWDIDRKGFLQKLSIKPVEGWNSFMLKNLPTGISYLLEITLNNKAIYRDLSTPGQKTLTAGLNFKPSKDSVELSFLYNNNSLADTVVLELSNYPDLSNPIKIDLSTYFQNNIEYYSMNFYKLESKELRSLGYGIIYARLKVASWKMNSILTTSFVLNNNTGSFVGNSKNTTFVYPNPIKNFCIIKSEAPAEIFVYDYIGQIRYTGQINTGETDLFFELPEGNYIIQKISKGLSFWQRIIIR